MTAKKVITDTMDSKEIVALLKEDNSFAVHKYFDTCKHYEKLAKGYSHRNDRVNFKPLSFKSAKGFNFVFRYYKRAADDPGEGKVGIDTFVWFMKNRGIYAISRMEAIPPSEAEPSYQVYIPHFFDRYRERYLKDPSIPKLDVVHHYMLSNRKNASVERQSEKYPGSVWSRCDDGLVLCQQIDPNIYECKTFITFDMTYLGERIFVDFAALDAPMHGFEFKLPDENFNEFKED